MINKTLTIITIIILLTTDLFSSDTITVRSHDHVDMTWYGNYDKVAEFSLTDQKLIEKYIYIILWGGPQVDVLLMIIQQKLKFFIILVILIHHFNKHPYFTVNGNSLDTLFITDTSYIYFWDTLSNSTDSMLSTQLQVINFSDSLNPTVPTDTSYYFPSGYYNFLYDSSGIIYDSIYVQVLN